MFMRLRRYNVCFTRVIIAFPGCHVGVAFGDAQCYESSANSTHDRAFLCCRTRGALSGEVWNLSWAEREGAVVCGARGVYCRGVRKRFGCASRAAHLFQIWHAPLCTQAICYARLLRRQKGLSTFGGLREYFLQDRANFRL